MQLEEEKARPASPLGKKTKKARHKAKRSKAAARKLECISKGGCDEPNIATASEAAASCSDAAEAITSSTATADREAPTAAPVSERASSAAPQDDEMLTGLLSDLGMSSPNLAASSDLAATSPASVVDSWMCCPITKVRPWIHAVEPQWHPRNAMEMWLQ